KSARVGVLANQSASLTVQDAAVWSPVVQIGTVASSNGTIALVGSGAVLTARDELTVGQDGSGTLKSSGGGMIRALGTTTIGKDAGSSGLLSVDGQPT